MSTTTFKGSYWDHDGKYQAQYQKAWDQLIPAQGEAEDGLPEALRAISRIGYDYYNNGFCNLWNRWDDVDEYGYDITECKMDSHYEDLVDYLYGHIPRELHREFTKWLSTTENGCTWGRGGDDVIDRIIDYIIEKMVAYGLLDETQKND